MTFKVRPIPKQFDTEVDFGLENLVVSGCSFTYNNSDTSACTWPYYLRDLGGFSTVFDTSLPGSGNYHIAHSLQWALENRPLDPKSTLVVVMWSGMDRDDYVCPNFNDAGTYPMVYRYNEHAISGITGGNNPQAQGNVKLGFKAMSQIKNNESRAIENYLYISSLYHYLTAQKYKFLFLNYMDRDLLKKTDFELRSYLPKNLNDKLTQYIPKQPKTDVLYSWIVTHNLLHSDHFHPSPDGHLAWTRQILIPMLQSHL